MGKNRFTNTCQSILNKKQESQGIGTLSEKSVHAVVKNYYCPDPQYHEIKILTFIADIFCNNKIIEIQNGNFDKLRRKLVAFLPLYPVTVVLPVIKSKWIYWINPDTGEIEKPRKSNKKGRTYDIFPQLYKIKNFLFNENLSFEIIVINAEEYRYLDGWGENKKRGATKCDSLPIELINEVSIDKVDDYDFFIPSSLRGEFTSYDFSKAASIPLSLSQQCLNILFHMERVKRVGKKGNSYLYKK